MTPLVLALGYFVGSIPFAFLLARLAGGVDIRRAGSGNVGTANVYRTIGACVAAAVMTLDMAKGALAVLIARRLGQDTIILATTAVAAVVGHVYPVWLRFHGGKGVATAGGAFGVLAPVATALAGLVFFVTVAGSRYVSLGSLGAAAALPLFAYLLGAPRAVVVGAAFCTILIVERHRSNLRRLQSGTERRLGQRA